MVSRDIMDLDGMCLRCSGGKFGACSLASHLNF